MPPKYHVIWKIGKFRKHKTLYKYTLYEIKAAQKEALLRIRRKDIFFHTVTGLTALFVKYNNKEYVLK